MPVRAAPDNSRRDLLILFALAVLLFSAGLGLKDPWPPDEPRFTLVAKEMIASGEWLFPRRGGELYPDKPPLFMWVIALFYWLSGSMRVAHLLPSMLAGLLSTALVYDLGRRLWHHRAGFCAGLALITIVQFTLQAKTAQIDGLLTFWVTLGVYGLVRHLLSGPAWGWYLIGFAAMGAGVITKGVGFLPLLLLALYLFVRWQNYTVPSLNGKWWYWASGPFAMLLVVAAWLVPMIAASGGEPQLEAYRDNILFHQTAERYATPWHHTNPPWFYLEQIVLLWFPATLLLPWLLPAWWRRLRRGDSRYLLLLGWVVLVVIFFSFSPAKRGVYISPAVPAVALAIGPLLPGLWRKPRVHASACVATWMLAVSILAVVATAALSPEFGAKLLRGAQIVPWPLLATIGATGLLLALALGRRRGLLALAAFLWSTWMLIGWWGYPLLNPIRSPAPFMTQVGQHIGPDAELGMVFVKEQFVLLADRPLTHFGFTKSREDQFSAARAWLHAEEKRWLLLPLAEMKRCFDPVAATYMGVRHRYHWFLVNRDAERTGECH
ncbi:MAG: ArnT family glycosyltransferase [Gammaproteobacteria bacterium]